MSKQTGNIRVGIDMDGVLSNFTVGYAHILTKLTGVEFPLDDPNFPYTWYWERAAGVEKNRENIAWQEIKKDPTFWLRLLPHEKVHEFLFNLKNDISGNDDIYFITNRMGHEVKWQTEQWLRYHGYKNPTVLIVGKDAKAAACNLLNLTHYIDDKQENCQDVKDNAPRTKGYMRARSYNTPIEGVPRFTELEEFMRELRRDSAVAIVEGDDIEHHP